MKKKVALHNLGCKVNAYEVEAMQQLLEQAGYEIVPFEPGADVYVINTCTVTNIADRKSRQMLHKAKKMNPDAVVVATGCYVQTLWRFFLNMRKNTSASLILSRSTRPGNTRNWRSAARQSMCVPTSRFRTAATSSAPTASFPMPEAVCEAGKKRIS